jgi:nucleoside-diphosphate-sugar epimerase
MYGPLPTTDLDEAIGRDPSIWEDFRGATVLLTGGTGFIGSWMVATLQQASKRLQLGTKIVLLTRNPEAPRLRMLGFTDQSDITLISGDVREPISYQAAVTHVVHAATDASAKLNTERPQEMVDTIIDGTRNTLAYAECHRPRRLLFLSSGAIYGKQAPASHVDEDCRLAPDPLGVGSAYGEGKRLAEQLCAISGRRPGATHLTIARCFAFVGPLLPLDVHFAIGNFIRDGIQGHEVNISGDGSAVRSYLYAGDLAAWLWTIMVRGQHLRPYNVGSDQGLDMRAIAAVVAGRFQPALAVNVLGRPSGVPPDIYVPRVERARSELGLQVWTPLATAVEKTISWHRHAGQVVGVTSSCRRNL